MTRRDYEREWMDAGYPKGMGSAKFLPPPDHAFLRVYHLTSAEHAISSVSLGRLKVTRFSEANDPFELMALNAHEHGFRKLLNSFKATEDANTGLLCFSKNWTNPLLWSHYATKHKGICLGFDLRRGDNVQEVQYARERPRKTSLSGKETEPIQKNLQDLLRRTKYIGWVYEQEVRRFVDLAKAKQEHGLYFVSFDQDLRLKEVILGERNGISLEEMKALAKATNPGAVVFKTRLERRDFRIVGDGRYPPVIPKDAA